MDKILKLPRLICRMCHVVNDLLAESWKTFLEWFCKIDILCFIIEFISIMLRSSSNVIDPCVIINSFQQLGFFFWSYKITYNYITPSKVSVKKSTKIQAQELALIQKSQ
jgi:hypothetical protein